MTKVHLFILINLILVSFKELTFINYPIEGMFQILRKKGNMYKILYWYKVKILHENLLYHHKTQQIYEFRISNLR